MTPLQDLLSTNGFMPHGFCYLWNPGLISLHVISDSLIALAYLLIPLSLIHLVRKRRDIPFNWMFVCFGVFIVACGATHVMEVWTLWVPSYWLSGGVKAVTALASMPTAVLLIRLMPKALSLPHPDDLRKANAALEQQASVLQEQSSLARQSEEKYRSLFEGAPCGILRVALDGTVLMGNPALSQMLGLDSRDELIGRILPAEFLRATCGRKRPNSAFEDAEIMWKRKDGKKVLLRAKAQPSLQTADSPACFEVIVEDISERRRLEEELRQAQKMETVGQLAGGIAHDFNNLLVAILGYGELVAKNLDPATRVHEYSMQITRAAVLARELTAQLLAFGRKQPLQPRIIDLNLLILSMTDMLVRTLGENIRLVQELATTLPLIRVDPVQFEQVLLNLAVNARDAMPAGGMLTIKTASEYGPDSASPTAREKHFTVVSVIDSGSGIDPDTLPHIFEPFFTTKSAGRGTGLGLAVVYTNIQQSGGFIDVETGVNKGTAFNIYLPSVEEHGLEDSVEELQGMPHPGWETILLVEDDEIVRTLTSQVLELEGYSVLTASSGSEAIERFYKSPKPIELLVTDVVMPDMNGLDLARELQQRAPDLRVLYVSGYLNDHVLPQMKLGKQSFFLAKPFLPQEFVGKVREILDAPGEREIYRAS